MPELSLLAWALLALGAVVVGLSKAALPGAGTVAVALFASVLPARQSTGALLLLLIVGDLFALWAYRRHADLRILVRLIPAVIAGVALGALFLAHSPDAAVRRVIGALLLAVVAVTLWRRRAADAEHQVGRVAGVVYGSLGGFTTMVANAAGPVMSMYFLAMRFPVTVFLGTGAWFFAIVNLAKLPFSFALGIITVETWGIFAVLAPVVIAAAFLGRLIAGRIDQSLFDRLVIALTVLGAAYLLFAL